MPTPTVEDDLRSVGASIGSELQDLQDVVRAISYGWSPADAIALYGWSAGQSRNGGVIAVGNGVHANRKLYGARAEAALRAQQRLQNGPQEPTKRQRAEADAGTRRREKAVSKETAKRAADKAIADPKSLSGADLTALATHLKTLTVAELKKFAKQIEAKSSGDKKALADRLVDYVTTGSIDAPQGDAAPLAPGTSPKAKKPPKDYKIGAFKLSVAIDTDDPSAVESAAGLAAGGLASPKYRAQVLEWAGRVDDPRGRIASRLSRFFDVPPRSGEALLGLIARGERREKFLSAKRDANESPAVFALRNYPELADVRGLVLEGIDSKRARESVHDLYEMGPLAVTLGKAGVSTFISDRPVPQTDDMAHLSGVQPRGYEPGKTWDDVEGCYHTARGTVIAGAHKGSGSIALLAHEAGHAVGHKLGLDDAPETVAFHEALYNRLPQYLQQGGPGGEAGRQEMIAESVAIVTRRGKEALAGITSAAFADWLESKLNEHGGLRGASAKTA
jgi:hypothetical protein